MNQHRPISIIVVAALMIIFGTAEIVTGFSHAFFGLHTIHGQAATYLGAGVGALYAAAGFLVITMRRRAALLAIVLLVFVVAGRILMVTTGLYPVNTHQQAAAIALGTAIVVAFAFFIGSKASTFQ
jgi:hypothetical protein